MPEETDRRGELRGSCRTGSFMTQSGQPSTTVPELSSGRSTAHWRLHHSRLADVHGHKTGPSTFPLSLVQRLHLPLPLSMCTCRCGRQHMISWATIYPLECAAAQVCREAGARVSTNILGARLRFGRPQQSECRRLEVVADGLTMWHALCTVGDRHDTGLAPATPRVCQNSSS